MLIEFKYEKVYNLKIINLYFEVVGIFDYPNQIMRTPK